jgi:hypothetical protein
MSNKPRPKYRVEKFTSSDEENPLYYYRLVARNGETLMTSQGHKSKSHRTRIANKLGWDLNEGCVALVEDA